MTQQPDLLHVPDDEDDEPGEPGWQRRILGADPAAVIGALPPQVVVFTAVTRPFAVRLNEYAAARGVSRESLLRTALREWMVREGLATVDEAQEGVCTRAAVTRDYERKVGRARGR